MKTDEPAPPDQVLRRAVLAGDEQAWIAWYEANYAALYRYVRWRCAGLRDWTEEVVQETWLVAVRRVRQFDPQQGPFSAWLRGIAANVLRNRLRRRKADAARVAALPAEPATGQDRVPEDSDRRERAQRVIEVLSSLPEHYEAVLRAKYLDGASVAQIAAQRSETPKAVESLLTRARLAFRDKYSDNQHPTRRPDR
jgi:RNA polymerase sigma-70 factor, ECF subfamily